MYYHRQTTVGARDYRLQWGSGQTSSTWKLYTQTQRRCISRKVWEVHKISSQADCWSSSPICWSSFPIQSQSVKTGFSNAKISPKITKPTKKQVNKAHSNKQNKYPETDPKKNADLWITWQRIQNNHLKDVQWAKKGTQIDNQTKLGKWCMNKMRISTKKNYTKGKKTNAGAEEYNNWAKKFTREVQQQSWPSIRKNHWIWRKIIWNYWVRGVKRKKKKSKESLRDFVGYQKTNLIYIMGVPEEESLLEEIMTKNFPTLRKKIDIQLQKAQKTPSRINQRDFHWDAL